ncbi:putative deoxyribonuclease TATDN2 [Oscarella lobularis]|uniref:putative deoxyribonuclease TATDN2 n=1 Tax=Oscarella lobularis TaxID=121494 RepID=UPI00331358C8
MLEENHVRPTRHRPKSRIAHEMKCFACGKEGHIKRNCPLASESGSRPRKCFRCGKEGHVQRFCSERPDRSSREAATPAPSSSVGFIDTHCHLEYLFERVGHRGSLSDFAASPSNAFPSNFDGCVTIYCDSASFSSFGTWEDVVRDPKAWAAFGLHPHNAKYYDERLETKIVDACKHPKAVAWGETGLDYAKHGGVDERKIQREVFGRQLKCAVALGKPVVIHSRDAEEDVLRIVDESLPRDWKIHLHCYTGSLGDAERFFRTFPNLYVGFTGVVTYDSAKVIRECVTSVPLERILLETDTPYMVPTSLKRNNRFSHPGMIPHVAQSIAQLKGLSLDEILAAARKNTTRMYGI